MRKGIKILGLSLVAALSMMAVTAAGAQAAGELKVNGAVLGAGLEAEISGTGAEGQLLVPGLGLTILCTSGLILIKVGNLANMAHGTAHVLYHGCHVVGDKFCKIYPTHLDRLMKTNAGLILATGLGLVIVNGGRHFAVASAASFTNILYTEEEGCTLPSETEVGGSAGFRIDTPTTESTSHQVLDINSTEEGEIGVSLLYGEEPSTIDGGNATGSLVGTYAGLNFSLN
jgi:hypothetical protein